MSNAVLLSQHNTVIGVDLSQEKIDLVNSKISPLEDKEMEEFLANKSLDLRAEKISDDLLKDSDFVIIATPTNYSEDTNYFDTSSVENVIELINKINRKAFIIIKSTIPVGFVDQVRVKYNNNNIIFSPEFCERAKLYTTIYIQAV